MATAYRDKLRAVAGGFFAGAVALILVASGAQAQTSSEEYTATIWIDPDGCDHWIIDDGVEGYLSARLTPDGRPVCSGDGAPNTVVGPFREGSDIAVSL